ncbi:small secreted protein [Streptomyces cavernae]|uniref:small secreted protein n=1 Tax=Streptomyces cavernae TaxID=2259034 RepID=UPI000FEBB0DD|nr:small secreted protein [Streptomyces cavernae]
MEGTNPVNKKLAVALSGGAVLVLALSGCSSDDSSEKLNAWAKEVCDAVQPQAKKIEAANAAIQKQTSDNSTPEDVQKTDSQAFKDMSDAYRAMGTAVSKAGAPDVEEGKAKQKNAVEELNSIASAYADLQKKVEGLETKDQAKFAEGLKDIATQLDQLSKTGSDALKKLEEGDVAKAMTQQKSCQAATTAPATQS